MRFWISFFLYLMLLGSQSAAAQDVLKPATVNTEQVRAELLAHAPQGVVPGATVWLGLRLQHAPGWHSYWKNPGDSGLPTELHWGLPAGIEAGEVAWPAPHKFPLGELANYGYNGTVLLPVPLQVGNGFAANSLDVTLHATWLVCKVECLPQEGRFKLQIPANVSTALHAAAFNTAWQSAPQDVVGSGSRLLATPKSLDVELQGLPGAWQGQKLEFYPETGGLIAPGAPWTQQWEAGTWKASVPLSPHRSESPAALALVVGLADHSAAAARMTLPVTGTWPPTQAVAEVSPELTKALATNAARAVSSTNPLGLWAALLGALVGGLILNLMPCVFPVLAIKVIGFARHAQDYRLHRLCGVAYTAGAVLSFMLLGGLLLGLRATGEQLGWGFQLQTPSVVAGLAVLFTLIGLNLAGVFEFGRVLPHSWAGLRLRHPAADAFLTGVLAVAVASPCTAPFMGASLGLAIGLPVPQALAVFAALGLGMALPYLAASWVPAVAQRLPKPGAWMQNLRHLLAFPMLATVVWLLWVLGQQNGIDAAAGLLLWLLVLALLVWAWARGGWLRRGIAPLAVAGLLALAWAGGTATLSARADSSTGSLNVTESAPQADGQWHAWNPERMVTAQQNGQTVLVDFTAAWCVTCQYNKATTLSKPDLLTELSQRGVVLLRADWTRRDPRVTEALATVGRNGVPTYAVYRPNQAAVVLPELLNTELVRAALGSEPATIRP